MGVFTQVFDTNLSRTCRLSIMVRVLGLFEVTHSICAVLQGLAALKKSGLKFTPCEEGRYKKEISPTTQGGDM